MQHMDCSSQAGITAVGLEVEHQEVDRQGIPEALVSAAGRGHAPYLEVLLKSSLARTCLLPTARITRSTAQMAAAHPAQTV